MATYDAKHPDWTDRVDEWRLMRHAERGPTEVKRQGQAYLPVPSGFKTQADGGVAMYAAYMARADYPDVIVPTLTGMVGLIHRTEAQIELPPALEYLWEDATPDGLPLEAFHRRLTGELLLMGRFAILTDVVEEDDMPRLAGYTAETLINWSPELDFFVLDESGPVRDGFEWRDRRLFRQLLLEDETYAQVLWGDGQGDTGEPVEARARGGGELDYVPLVVGSARDLSLEVVTPPLIGVARAALRMYQLDADYRHQLFSSGQETLFISGSEKLPTMVGAGAVFGLEKGGTAQYVGPSGVGIDAHRQAIMDAKEDAVAAGAQLFDVQSGQESGEALRLRYAAQTATLTTVAQTSAQLLERSLRDAAMFMGADPDVIVVKPNLKFVDAVMTPADARQLMEVWMGGAISKLTMFENLQRGEIISAEREFEEEEDLIAAESADEPMAPSGDDEGLEIEEGEVSDEELEELFDPSLLA